MDDYANDFSSLDGHIWLNTASEGALPRVAARALLEAVEWKQKPFLLTHEKFAQVPRRLKKALGRLINVPAQDIILGNSATYGIDLLANGIPWKKGDEVLTVENDFPVDILPWLALEKNGVTVRQFKPELHVLRPDELKKSITSKTRLFCISHVHTFSGHKADIIRLGEICRKKGIIFVVNLTQTLGNTPVDVTKIPVDAVTSSGFKWLCGPYGTGFCWIASALREQMDCNHAFWVSLLNAEDLASSGKLTLPDKKSACKYDVFGTANFFNFHPWAISLEYLLDAGIGNIHRHNDLLVEEIIQRLDPGQYQFISPSERLERSCLVVISHKDQSKNPEIFKSLTEQGVHTALWKGNIRISPHLYNSREDIDRLLSLLRRPVL